MRILPISKEELLIKYSKRIDDICDIFELKTTFSGEEICDIIHNILTDVGFTTELTSDKLFEIYNEYVIKLNLTDEEWRTQYEMAHIVYLIYDLLEENS